MITNFMKGTLKRNPLIAFFSLAYAISWVLWIPLYFGRFEYGWDSWEGNVWGSIRPWLGLLGALGPALSAIIVTYFIEGKNGVKLLLKKVVQWRTKKLYWLIALYFWWVVASVLALILNLSSVENVSLNIVFAIINIPVILFVLQSPVLIGMFGEELGWRGFALPNLLKRYNPIISSLIIALFWLFWHAPLAIFPAWLGHMPLEDFLLKKIILIVPLTLIFTWFYQKTKGSVLLVIVLHFAFNLTFNGFKQAIGIDEEAFQLLRDNLLIALSIFGSGIVVYYLFQMKNKSKNMTSEELQ